jgi:hypothetical protein
MLKAAIRVGWARLGKAGEADHIGNVPSYLLPLDAIASDAMTIE